MRRVLNDGNVQTATVLYQRNFSNRCVAGLVIGQIIASSHCVGKRCCLSHRATSVCASFLCCCLACAPYGIRIESTQNFSTIHRAGLRVLLWLVQYGSYSFCAREQVWQNIRIYMVERVVNAHMIFNSLFPPRQYPPSAEPSRNLIALVRNPSKRTTSKQQSVATCHPWTPFPEGFFVRILP